MASAVILIVMFIMLCQLIAEVGPDLLHGIGHLIGLLLRFLLRAVLWLLWHGIIALLWAARMSGRGLYLGALFLFYLADEWRRGSRDDADAAEEEGFGEAPGDDQHTVADAYEQALALLGLAPGFTRAALKSAWRAAIRAAHPDAGGTAEAAQAVNAAYDLILQAHGWAR